MWIALREFIKSSDGTFALFAVPSELFTNSLNAFPYYISLH